MCVASVSFPRGWAVCAKGHCHRGSELKLDSASETRVTGHELTPKQTEQMSRLIPQWAHIQCVKSENIYILPDICTVAKEVRVLMTQAYLWKEYERITKEFESSCGDSPSIYCIIWVRLYAPATALLNCLFLRISFFSNLLTLNKYKWPHTALCSLNLSHSLILTLHKSMEQLAYFVLTTMRVLGIQNHSESTGSYLNIVYILSAFYHGPISLYSIRKHIYLQVKCKSSHNVAREMLASTNKFILINHSFVHVCTHNLHTDLCVCTVAIWIPMCIP